MLSVYLTIISDTWKQKKIPKKSQKKPAQANEKIETESPGQDKKEKNENPHGLDEIRPCDSGFCDLEIIERLPVRDTGKPPMIFIHGAFIGAACWAEYFLDYFAEKGHRAIALSLRGHGSSWGGDRLHFWHKRLCQ